MSSKFPTHISTKKRKNPFESDALHKSNTDKASNPFVSLFSNSSSTNAIPGGSGNTPNSGGGSGCSTSSAFSPPNSNSSAFSFGNPAAAQPQKDNKKEDIVPAASVVAPFCFSPVKPRDSFGNPISGPGFPTTTAEKKNSASSGNVSPNIGPSSPHSDGSVAGTNGGKTIRSGSFTGNNNKQQSSPSATGVSPRLSFGGAPSASKISPQLQPSSTPVTSISAGTNNNAPLSTLQAGSGGAAKNSGEDEPTYVLDGPGKWVCTTCNKLKPLQGQHLVGKNRVRSDCWPCAKKRLFQYILYTGAQGSQKSSLSTTSNTVAADRSTGGNSNVMSSFQLPAATTVAGSGSHAPRSSAIVSHSTTSSIQAPTGQKAGQTLPTPSPASWNLNAVAAKASSSSSSTSAAGPISPSPLGGLIFPSNPKSTTTQQQGERSPKSGSHHQQNQELKASLSEAQVALQASLRLAKFNASLVAARQTALMSGSQSTSSLSLRYVAEASHRELANTTGTVVVRRLFAQVPSSQPLDEGLLALAITDLFQRISQSISPLHESPIDLSICCHNEECFSAMGLYTANSLLAEQDNRLHASRNNGGAAFLDRLRVFGPAFDKTTKEKNKHKEVFEQLEVLLSAASISPPATTKKPNSSSASPRTAALPIGGGAGFEVQVSHQAVLDATAPLYDATGWVSENTTGMAISSQLEAMEAEINREVEQHGGSISGTSNSGRNPPPVAVHLVLCAPSVPYKQLKSQLF